MIKTQNLTKTYGRTTALSDLTFNVPEGSVFALAGTNGAGKSSLIRILTNLIQPTSGRAEVFGVDSTKLGPAELSSIDKQIAEHFTGIRDIAQREMSLRSIFLALARSRKS